MILKTFLGAIIVIFLAAPALAQKNKMSIHHHSNDNPGHGKIIIKDPWARASITKNGVSYLTIMNHGKHPEKLIGVMAPVAKRIELHTHKNDDGIMRMRQIKDIPLPPHGSVSLKPGGHHIMMIGLNRKLKLGDKFPLTLLFEKRGNITVTVKVRHAGALGQAPNHDNGKHKMKH
ncbi:MAG: hypothetical protein CMM75_03445 [Rhodospirillaceae bacterium]|nr:hypothetical protein [Rhodospirillaceae bacterium]